jgi:hypothetical protein
MKRGFAAFAALLAAVVLSACGGGGGSSPGGGGPTVIANRAPTAVAGAAQTVATGAVVTFSGAGSSDPDGNTITYAWTLTSKPAGSVATLTGATTVSPTLRADRDGAYGVSLVVSDGSLSSAASTTTATATTNAADQTAAANARATANVDLTSATATLQWQDSFPAGSSYRVESQASDGSFTPIETATGGSGAIIWTRAYVGPVVYRIVALTAGREIPVLTSTGAATLDASALGLPDIVVSKPEPVSGSATLTFAPAYGGSTLSWTVDGDAIATGNGVTWNTSSLPDASHVVAVHVDLNTGVFVDTRKAVATANSALNVSASYAQVSATRLFVDVRASSPAGVTSVEARMDALAPEVLTAKNACPAPGCVGGTGFTVYEFTYNPTTLGSGAHTVTIKATETGGGTKTISLPVTIANAPGLTVASPQSGAFVFGSLTITGATTTDTGQPVTTTASLGGTQFMSTTAANFSGSVSLAGRSPGAALLLARATDANSKSTQVAYNIVVASSASLAHTPLFSAQETDTILAAEGDLVLLQTSSLARFVRNVTAGANVNLATVNGVTGRLWLTADSVYGAGTGIDAGCKSGDTCIYRWSTTTGLATNVSASDPNVPSAVVNVRSPPVVRGRYVVWRNQLANGAAITYTLYDSQTNSYTSIPTVTDFTASARFDLAVVGGAPTLVYGATRSGSGVTAEIVKWSSGSGTSVLVPDAGSFLTTAGVNPSQLQTDGTSVAYLGGSTAFSLFLLPISGGAATTLDTPVGAFLLREGTATWRRTSAPTTTKAWSSAQGVVTLDSTTSPDPQQSAGSGVVAYHGLTLPGLRTWNGATGATVLKADGGPFIPFITGNRLYFKSGTGVYRVDVP